MILNVEAGEDHCFKALSLEPPARQRRAEHLLASHLDTAGQISIGPAADEHLEGKARLLQAARRPQHAGMRKAAVTPDVGARKEQVVQ
jgi:hypothetical protein